MTAGLIAAYAALSFLAALALAEKHGPAPTPNRVIGDFLAITSWNGCEMRVKLAATSRADFTGASGTVRLTADTRYGCGGQASGRVTCLLLRHNQAFLSWWLTDRSGMFTVGTAMEAVLTENDPQVYGPPVDRAGFDITSSPECPPEILGKGSQLIDGTFHILQAGQAEPFGEPLPTLPALPTPPPAVWPTRDPSMNYAAGDIEVLSGWNGCKIRVKFAATSKADRTGSYGAFLMAAVPGDSCEGQASGRITCLMVDGNSATFVGWLDDSDGSFTMANVIGASLTEHAPQAYGPPVDRASVSLYGGTPECPPGLNSSNQPQIISGSLQVSPARHS